jgi:hypothetical protein
MDGTKDDNLSAPVVESAFREESAIMRTSANHGWVLLDEDHLDTSMGAFIGRKLLVYLAP